MLLIPWKIFLRKKRNQDPWITRKAIKRQEPISFKKKKKKLPARGIEPRSWVPQTQILTIKLGGLWIVGYLFNISYNILESSGKYNLALASNKELSSRRDVQSIRSLDLRKPIICRCPPENSRSLITTLLMEMPNAFNGWLIREVIEKVQFKHVCPQ